MQLQELLSDADRLPSLPKVLRELVAAFDRPEPDIDRIVLLISSDPTLAAKILRVANSAFFRRGRSVGGVKDAVMLMGLHTVRLLVLSAGMAGAVHFLDRETRTQFWRYSLNVAVCARYFAKLTRHDGDVAFTAGLIHAIGEPLMCGALAAEMLILDEDSSFFDEQRVALERMALGYAYPDVGAALAELWQFPPMVAGAIRAASDPFAAGSFSALAACVHLGTQIASSSERAEPQDVAFSMLDTRLLEALKLDSATVAAMPPLSELSEGLQSLVA